MSPGLRPAAGRGNGNELKKNPHDAVDSVIDILHVLPSGSDDCQV
jgi:hypothetical protein